MPPKKASKKRSKRSSKKRTSKKGTSSRKRKTTAAPSGKGKKLLKLADLSSHLVPVQKAALRKVAVGMIQGDIQASDLTHCITKSRKKSGQQKPATGYPLFVQKNYGKVAAQPMFAGLDNKTKFARVSKQLRDLYYEGKGVAPPAKRSRSPKRSRRAKTTA